MWSFFVVQIVCNGQLSNVVNITSPFAKLGQAGKQSVLKLSRASPRFGLYDLQNSGDKGPSAAEFGAGDLYA